MAEETEQHEKTEDPTPKRIEEARQKGDVATSREVNHWFIILAATVSAMMFVPGMFARIGESLSRFLAIAGTVDVTPAGLGMLLRQTLLDLGVALLPVLLLFLAAALGAGLIQNGLVLSAEPLVPKLEKLSLVKGVKRLFSIKALVEFAKSLLKIAVVGTVVTLVLLPKLNNLGAMITLDTRQLLALLQSLAVRMLIAVLSVMTAVTILDVLYQRFEHFRKLRMSRHEIKEELKQSEGDPHLKARLRQIRMERARRRMMAKVPEADVVITNPTHYAVALRYDAESMAAPCCLAKGIDSVALRIREAAEEHSIPLVENPPLARALYGAVDLDEEIPPEHYRAVAEVIGYVMGMKQSAHRG